MRLPGAFRPAERGVLFVGPLATRDTNLYVLNGPGIEIANLDQAKKSGRIATVAKYYSGQMLAAENVTNTVSNSGREGIFHWAGPVGSNSAILDATPAEVVASWQATLDQLKKDGTCAKIYRDHLPDAELGDLLDRQ
jgi:hypothetical protein